MGSNHVPNLVKWVESFSGELYSWALYKISDPELAKDLVQDTFLAAAEKKESFRGNSSPRSWLFAILNHMIIDVYRKRIKQPLYWDDHFFSGYFDEDNAWKRGKTPVNWHEGDGNLMDNTDFRAA
ncbi:MAG: sigma factor [Bacteroidales bacterium]